MKFLHYSDRVSSEFTGLYNQSDILVSTGDLSIFDFVGLRDNPNKKPAFGVYGNHDSGSYMEQLGIVNLHNKVIEYKGLKWGGWQGCLRYKTGELQFSEEEASIFANQFPRVDILLLHVGPKGILDDPKDAVHAGSENIYRYVTEKRPKIVFLGHQYSDAYMEAGGTKFYRTYGVRLIDIEL
jgi:uncharacterized protein